MKIPTITQVLGDARRSLLRFPIVLLDAFAGSIAAIALIDRQGATEPTVLFRVLFAAILGFPLLAGLALMAEKKKWSTSVTYGSQITGVILAALYALTVPTQLNDAPASHALRLVFLSVGLVLFAFVGPYLRSDNAIGFWQYCKTLLTRLAMAFLYGVVLWVGLAIALAALDNLFGIDVPGKRYGELWVFIHGVFTPWFFLAGIPEDLQSLDTTTIYPKSLKLFSQYILFPLVLVYFVILYAYLAKILVAWDWPQGWVSRLILGFIGTGLGWMILVDPIREQIENRWIKSTSRWFFFIVIPLVLMLFLAVWRRVSEYGITEGRYVAIVVGIWLCVIVPYFVISKKKNIIVIPATFALASFIVSFGPWGVLAVSEQSQITRLKGLLEKNNILVAGAVQSRHDSVSIDDRRQISSILSYLSEFHGFDGIQPWFGESLKRDSLASAPVYREPSAVASLMGIEYIRIWQSPGGGYMNMNADQDRPRDISGYTRMLRGQHLYEDQLQGILEGDVRYHLESGMTVLVLSVRNEGGGSDSIRIDFRQTLDRLVGVYGSANTDKIPPEEMSVTSADDHLRVKVILWHVRLKKKGENTTPISYEADILYEAVKRAGPR
jgi:hypothetical protein